MSSPDLNPLELAEVGAVAAPGAADTRPRLPEPLPVRLVAVEDVRLPAPEGIEDRLDAFYVGLLEFARLAGGLAYRADNFTLRFHRPLAQHESLRPLGIEVLSLLEAERKLIAGELEYTRQRGVTPGDLTLLVLDPAGNWLELCEARRIG